jgi:hypothetical protein
MGRVPVFAAGADRDLIRSKEGALDLGRKPMDEPGPASSCRIGGKLAGDLLQEAAAVGRG